MELKPCKCGNTHLWKVKHRYYPRKGFARFTVECCHCGFASKLCRTMLGAVRDWNRCVGEGKEK